jgi:hypothetical protein
MKICDMPPGLHHLFDFGEPTVRPDVVAAARARIERDGSASALDLADLLLEQTRFATRMEDLSVALT